MMQATSRIPGDGTDGNYYSDAQNRHESPGPDINDNINAYAELGDVNKVKCHTIA